HAFVLHHLVAGLPLGRKDGPAYLAAMERDAGILGRLVAHGVLEGRVAPIWETRPDEFPLVGQILEAATALIVHSHYVERRARAAGFRGPLWRIPHPRVARACGRSCARRGASDLRLLRPSEREQANPAARRCIRARASTPSEREASARRPGVARIRRGPLPRRRHRASRLRSREQALVA